MRFVVAAQVPDVCTGLTARKFLVVGASAGPLAPAGLRRRIDDAVEGELADRGALPAAISMDAELASCIRDQVFRARALGTTGLAIALPPLSELTDGEGRLNVDDSAALLAWTRATAELPVVLLASEADRMVSAYAPMPLERLLASEGRAAPPAPPPAVDEATWMEASREPPSDPFDMTPPPPASAGVVVSAREEARARMTPAPSAVGPRPRPTPLPPPVSQRPVIEPMVAPRNQTAPMNHGYGAAQSNGHGAAQSNGHGAAQSNGHGATTSQSAHAPMNHGYGSAQSNGHGATTSQPAPFAHAEVAHAAVAQPAEEGAPRRLKSGILKGTKPRPAPEPVRPAESADSEGDTGDDAVDTRPLDPRAHEAVRAALAAPRGRMPEDGPHETATLAARARDTGAARAVNSAEWRSMAVELDAARGPKPVRVIEQLFMTRYVPLVGALARGEADGAVRGVVDGWAQAFEHSYTDAFSAMRVTGKRPMMTFDAPEIASRVARLNGARTVKLLLVDSMGYDLGERVAAELRARATASGVCVDRLLLWSALPTTTQMQCALLARGGDGLRDVEPPSDQEPEIARGRAVATLRRERLGAREIMKLDLVEARLRTAGPAYEERLDAIADEVATVLARFLESLPPRTLLFVFGDHGFRLPKSPDGRATGPATQGGASPEEVLVPAYAWLSGGVH